MSASLDGEIIIWSSHTLQPIKQFNEMHEFEGESHLYPYSVQHMVVIDQVGDMFIFLSTVDMYLKRR